jgi:hypothetical protein
VLLCEPLLQSDAPVEGHERGKSVATAADDPALSIVISVREVWQALTESLVVIEAPLETVVIFVEEKPAHNSGPQSRSRMLLITLCRSVEQRASEVLSLKHR